MEMPTTIDLPLYTDAGGKIRVGSSRVLLELVIHAYQQGATAEEIVDSYSTLKLADVYAVLAHYLKNRAEVDAYVRASEAAVAQIQREAEANYSPEIFALRARLRAQRDNR